MSDVSKTTSQNDVDTYDYADNYDPNKVEVEEVINAVFAIDVSGSIGSCVKDLNNALNEFTERMQKSHAKDKLFVSRVDFNSVVEVAHGFKPISELQHVDLSNKVNGPYNGSTKLYEGVKTALKNALDYRASLEQGGINVKTLLFIITDGDDNDSPSSSASDVKNMIAELQREERNIFSFESIIFGVGSSGSFEEAQREMNIHHLAKVGTTADEIRKMINFISSSVTSVSTGGGISAPTF
jgi:uncharacterized protein YegL